MAVNVRVNGAALIQIDQKGGSGFEDLGYSENGVTMNITQYETPVFTDEHGQGAPRDVVFLGQDATIDIELIAWDWDVLNEVISLIRPATTAGELSDDQYGCLYVRDDLYFAMKIKGTKAGEYEWTFPIVWLRDVQSHTVGTRESRWTLQFYALPNYAASSSTVELYTRSVIS